MFVELYKCLDKMGLCYIDGNGLHPIKMNKKPWYLKNKRKKEKRINSKMLKFRIKMIKHRGLKNKLHNRAKRLKGLGLLSLTQS